MKQKNLLATFIISIFMMACANNQQQDSIPVTYSNVKVDSTYTNKPIPDSIILKSIMQPGARMQAVPAVNNQPLPVANSTPLPGNSAGGLNPAHGQPGHRCDIAVGAPLNSKPAIATATAAQPAAVNNQPVAVNTIQPVAQKTAPGMNPPHGQPNHRCDIAVGAPLNSKPAVTTSSKGSNTAATVVPAPVQKVAPGMNPSHGQPGHRCDIAVGAPLNSKPSTSPALPVPVSTDAVKNDSTK